MGGENKSSLLHSIPALVALVLGGIYALGAISIFGQLKAADLNAIQLMPLVPIDQILGRGIGAATSEAAKGLLIGIPFAIAMQNAGGVSPARKTANSPDEHSQPKRLSKAAALGGVLIVLGLLLALLPLGDLAVYGVAVPVEIAVLWGALRWLEGRENKKWSVGLAVAAGYFSFLIVAAIVGAFTRAAPLPEVTLMTWSGPAIHGELVVADGSTWYLQQPKGEVVAIPNRNVRRATMRYPPTPDGSNLLDKVRD